MINNKKHLLVLYSHNPSRLDHLNKLNSLRKKYSITLIMDKKDNMGFQSKFVDNIIEISMGNSIEEIDDIMKKIDSIGIPDGILNLSELCVPLHSLLGKKYNILSISEEAATIARNKYNMRKFCQKLNIPVPKSCIIDDEINKEIKKFKFPVVVKPCIGGGSTLVQRFEKFEDLINSIDFLKKEGFNRYTKDPLYKTAINNDRLSFVVEELIGGETQFKTLFPYNIGEISVESIFFNGKCEVLAIHDKMIPQNGPYFEEYIWSTPTRIPIKLQKKAKQYVEKIHKSLGKGCYVLHTEFRTFKDDLVLIEFGARLGGGPIYNSILTSTGNDYIEILIDISLGKEVDINKDIKYPTITHCLWAERDGKIKAIKGLAKGVFNPYFRKVQIYDDVGAEVYRAPRSCRANGHIVFSNDVDNDFECLERSTINAINTIKFELI